MRILIAHALYPPDFAGGGEYVVQEVARGLQARGADVRVITTGDPSLNLIEGVPVHRLPISRYRFNFAVRAICREARNADLIQTFNYHACAPAWLAGQITGKPVVCTILGQFGRQWRELRGPIIGRAFEYWERGLLHIPYDSVVFLSEFSKAAASAQVAANRSLVFEPGISLDRYYCAEKENYILFVGKLESRKGVDLVLEAARLLSHIPFKLIGWSQNAEAYRRVAPPNVTIMDFERGQPLYDAFARARIFLFPSRAETFGLVVAEAMASGCAVVSSVPLPFEGEHVAADDLSGIVAAIDRLWNNQALTEEMGRENLRCAQVYSWDRHIHQLWTLYEDLLDRRMQSLRSDTRSMPS